MFLLPAMQNIERAVSDLGVKVSTATDTNGFSRFPPSSGSFTPDFRIFFIDPVLSFLVSKKSPPAREYLTYFTYVNNMRDLSLEYALLISNKTVVNDGSNSYRNLFLAFLDTIYAALEKSIAGSVKIVVSESSWPTSGGTAASVDNARTYENNFIQIVKTGSPRRPERAIEAYIVRF
ncbi:hypothetical protein F2Q69_00014908 [Brassica cretica]|uniref:glucan endo-1,3-beta-D-glucosidase n=1 Tax=Brassica cretica TaxID=69181 RepID=A0A8S9R077_BRACR|nr:hypothetical protein F2Q69_00014908 [Brassica cretica]